MHQQVRGSFANFVSHETKALIMEYFIEILKSADAQWDSGYLIISTKTKVGLSWPFYFFKETRSLFKQIIIQTGRSLKRVSTVTLDKLPLLQ